MKMTQLFGKMMKTMTKTMKISRTRVMKVKKSLK